jgi:hypothetical protein
MATFQPGFQEGFQSEEPSENEVGYPLGRSHRYIDPAIVYVGTAAHLNAMRLPTDPEAATDFAYLTTDGSPDAPYLRA